MSFNKKPKTINPDEVDPSVYYYDEVYDDMKDKEEDSRKKDESKKPKRQESKYIQGIIETADRRKSEKEIRKFKRYARDREEADAKGELKESDVYITKAYEKKLKEVQDSLKKHSECDDERTLNLFKKHKKHDDREESTSGLQPASKVATTSNTTSPNETAAETSKTHQATKDQVEETRAPRPKPKTIEERREYLRGALAKRTVGDVLRAAQERYKQRKAKATALY